jgi:protein-tyrosine kinase
MENIRQAIERVKARTDLQGPPLAPLRQQAANFESRSLVGKTELDLAYLQSRRIVAHDGKDPRSRAFDILRTEVLHSMDEREWKILAVTSPTPGCGKTLVAINLALSMGRQPDRQVLLADFDLRKPQVATTLGLKFREGLNGVIDGRLDLDRAVLPIQAANSSLEVLPTTPNTNAADLIDASGFDRVLTAIADYARSRIIILDLPPLLIGHDVISVLPRVDCVLLVGAAGVSTVSDIEECEKHLQTTHLVRFVLNKMTSSQDNYVYY